MRGKKVVITGGAGMLGSHLAELLISTGADVVILDNLSRGHNHIDGARYVEFPWNDATDPILCETAFSGAHTVFNLAAAVGGLYHNLSHQTEQFWENMKLQAIPALAAAKCEVTTFVQVSTVCVYADRFNSPALEVNGHLDEPEPANAGYAWAKRMGERVCSWAFEDSLTTAVVVRPTNMYGPRDYFDEKAHVIPALVRKFLSGDPVVKVYGGPQTREFLYVEDAAKGLITVATEGKGGGVYNLGTNGRTVSSIHGLALLIKALTRSRAEIEFIIDRPTGDGHRRTDSSKAEALGWKATTLLPDGLASTIEWYKNESR
jgi:nucleoside-diphosphate-sugar epimerase